MSIALDRTLRIPPHQLFSIIFLYRSVCSNSLPLHCFAIMLHAEYSHLFSYLNRKPHTPCTAYSSLLPLPALLIHWLLDWEASLAIWENNVILGWAELLNPLWDYSLPLSLSASVITDHRKRKKRKSFLYCVFLFPFSPHLSGELFSTELPASLCCYSPSLFSLLVVFSEFKSIRCVLSCIH